VANNSTKPIRQCIGCRSLRPKDELLRFARMQSLAPSFDFENKLEGRGFYLCPNTECFRNVFRNKKNRATYFSNWENLEEVKREVLGTILRKIKRDLNLCKKMRYFYSTRNEEKSIHEDDGVLLWCDSLPEEKVTAPTTAFARDLKLFLSKTGQETLRNGSVNQSYPVISRLMLYLQKYEVFSSKGPVL
jgi:uncharacterized protein